MCVYKKRTYCDPIYKFHEMIFQQDDIGSHVTLWLHTVFIRACYYPSV